MTNVENLLSLLKRTGYDKIPVDMLLCPHLIEVFKEKTSATNEDYLEYFNIPLRTIPDILCNNGDVKKYYNDLKPGTVISAWGIAYEQGSSAAKHMTRMISPMRSFDSVEQIEEYPFPCFKDSFTEIQSEEVKKLHERDLAAVGHMACTVWEMSWYLRGMEELMMDMMCDDPMADVLLNKVTDISCKRAVSYAEAGVDIIWLGDDVGMQKGIMMSEDLYCTWIKPRLKKVIDSVKAVKPNILIVYHSCGFITPFIPHLIEVGIDVLNPVQPECMDFKEIHDQFGDKLSFHGTIGTQTTMPFGTPEDVRKEVFRNLEIAGDKGGLFCAPTHLLEPEVPWENIEAYVKACRDWTK